MTPKIKYLERDGRLVIAIYVNKQRGLYDTGIQINSDLWDEEKQKCGDPSVNTWMVATIETLQKQFRPDITPKRLWASFINGQSETTATIKQCFDYYINNMPLRENSKGVYLSTAKSLQHAGIYQTPLIDVTPALMRSFFNGLKTADSSKFSTLVRIKTALTRYVRDHRLNITFDLDSIVKKPRYTMKENDWLTEPEVQKLLDEPFKFAKKDARDLFCLSCFSGMSVADALLFDPKKHIQEINGRDFIVFNRTKTGVTCRVPVIAQAKAIIESREWPVVINRRSYQRIVSNFDAITGKRMHTHLARKTFGCLFLTFGFSIETVSKLMGHSNTNLTSKIYSRVTQEKVERELAEIGI